jgi:hypothetical protein
MQIEPWQIPVLGMALLALPPAVSYLVHGARDPSPKEKKRPQWVRTGIFVVATVVLTVVFLVALGTELADVVTSVAAAVAGLISAGIAIHTGKQTVEANRPRPGSKARHTQGDR